MKRIFLSFLLLLMLASAISQKKERYVPIKYGDMEHWTVRYIEESKLLGGQTKTLYVLGPTDTIKENAPFDFSVTPWAISNAYAKMAGIEKGSCTTQPEKRGNGTCARLDTRMEQVKVMGIIDVEVLIQGTLFLGQVVEPVTSTKDPYAAIDVGIPFTKRPKGVMFDYKCRVSPEHTCVKATGMSKKSTFAAHDEPEVYVYLQKRWEDAKGNIYAKRIGTVRHRFDKTQSEWVNGYKLYIHYGDISHESWFRKWMGLYPDGGQFKAMNSKGKMVKVTEVGWADADEQPTHVILMITAGCFPVYYGHPGNAMWVDNVKWIY